MKKTISCLIAAFCGTCSLLSASSDFSMGAPSDYTLPYSASYGYVCAGFGPVLPVPHIGVGYRQRFQNQLGWDTSLVFATGGVAHQLGLNVMAHYYLHSEQHNSVYLGTGVRANGYKENGKSGTPGSVSLDTVIGKVLTSDGDSNQFIELHFCSPSVWTNRKIDDITGKIDKNFTAEPMVYLTYGVGF